MNLRFALLAVGVCLAAYACATPEQQTATPSAARAQPPAQDRYVTGSRVPIRDDGGGSSSVGSQSKADFEEEMRRMTQGSHGQ